MYVPLYIHGVLKDMTSINEIPQITWINKKKIKKYDMTTP
jgi:hypothetical protein